MSVERLGPLQPLRAAAAREEQKAVRVGQGLDKGNAVLRGQVLVGAVRAAPEKRLAALNTFYLRTIFYMCVVKTMAVYSSLVWSRMGT